MAPKFKRAETFDEFTTERYDVVLNKLLGDYNANGIYVINKKVAAELLEIKKTKKESYNNEIFCTAKTTSGKIVDFDISFKKNSASKMAVAELYVLEGVPKQGGRMMNVLKTPIAKFTQEISPNFVDLALANFNVVINASDEGMEYKEVDDAYIVKRNTLLGFLDKMTADSYNIVYEDYFTQRINMLKSMNNAYSKKVLAIFNEEFNKISDYFLVDKKNKKVTNYKAMNELLDKAFEDLADLDEYKEQEKMFKERILPILTMFVQGAERVNSSAMKSVLDTVPRRMKDTLTEPLMDKKQAEESRLNPTVKETSKETLKKEIDVSIEKIKSGSDKVSGRVPLKKGRMKTEEEPVYTRPEPVKGATADSKTPLTVEAIKDFIKAGKEADLRERETAVSKESESASTATFASTGTEYSAGTRFGSSAEREKEGKGASRGADPSDREPTASAGTGSGRGGTETGSLDTARGTKTVPTPPDTTRDRVEKLINAAKDVLDEVVKGADLTTEIDKSTEKMIIDVSEVVPTL